MKKFIAFLMALILTLSFIPVAGSNEVGGTPATPTDLEPTSLTVTKVLNGEIWSLRCDTMDNTDFKAGGGYWMADINNPAHNTSKEGHRSNHCGNRENWVLFVSNEGVAISLYQLKSGSTGGTLPSIVYRAPADLRSIPEGQFIYDPTDPDDVITKRLIEEVFIPQNAMPFSEINLIEGQRLFWISQNGQQVWHHTGVLRKTTPRFAFIINGEPYTLGVGETITLTEVEEGLLEIEEIATSNYKMVEITNDGKGNYVVINEIDPPDKPTPTPPPPVVTPTPTPSPTPEETETPSSTPEETESPSPTPEETESPSPTPEETETPSPTPEETETPNPTPEETETPSPTPEVTDEPSPSPDPTCGFTIKKIVTNYELMDSDAIFFFKIHGVGFEEDEYIEITVDHTTGIGTWYIDGLKPGKYSITEIDISEEFELVSDENITLYVHEFDTEFVFKNKMREPKPSESPSLEPSEKPSPSPEVSESPSPSPKISESPSPSPEVSESPSPSPEVSESPSPIPSRTPPPTTVTPSEVPSDSPTSSSTPSPTPTVTTSPIPSGTPEESESPSPSPTPEESETPSPTPSPTPEETESPTPPPTTITPSEVPSDSPTPSPTPSPSPTVTTSPIPSETPKDTATPIDLKTPTPSPTPEESEKPSENPTPSPTPSETLPQETPLPTTTVINRVYEVPYFPPDQPRPQMPGKPVGTIDIEDYKIALGIGVTINHVGDCFD